MKIIKSSYKKAALYSQNHRKRLLLKGKRSTVSLDFHSIILCAAMRGNWVLKTLKDVDLLRPQCTRNDFTNNNLIMIFTVYYDVL